MISGRRVLTKPLALLLSLVIGAAATSALPLLAAETEGDRPGAEPAADLGSLLQGLAGALGLADSGAAAGTTEKQDQEMQKALEEAQAAYEKEQKELQDKLRSDPKWKPSHEQVRVIKVGEQAQKWTVNNFCLNRDGDLLVCCGRSPEAEPLALVGPPGEPTPAADSADRGKILVFGPDGKQRAAWKLPFEPQAIGLASDGTVYVGGAGRLCRLSAEGQVLLSAETPSAAELPPLPEIPQPAAEPQGAAAEAARKAKQEEIAALQKKVRETLDEYQQTAEAAAKDLKPDDEAAMEAYQAKLNAPLEKYQALQERLEQLQMTPEVRAAQLRMQREQQLEITGLAVTDRDVFLACRTARGYGYAVWRTDREFQNPKKVVENLSGCCGQMDIQASEGELWVAHNGRHKVEHYDRDGQRLSSFGKRDRTSADGFGGCCEPKNLRFAVAGEVFAAESGPPTCVKRFSGTGEFRGVAVIAPWNSGCVRVTTEFHRDSDQFFVLNSDENAIHVFGRKPADAAAK